MTTNNIFRKAYTLRRFLKQKISLKILHKSDNKKRWITICTVRTDSPQGSPGNVIHKVTRKHYSTTSFTSFFLLTQHKHFRLRREMTWLSNNFILSILDIFFLLLNFFSFFIEKQKSFVYANDAICSSDANDDLTNSIHWIFSWKIRLSVAPVRTLRVLFTNWTVNTFLLVFPSNIYIWLKIFDKNCDFFSFSFSSSSEMSWKCEREHSRCRVECVFFSRSIVVIIHLKRVLFVV